MSGIQSLGPSREAAFQSCASEPQVHGVVTFRGCGYPYELAIGLVLQLSSDSRIIFAFSGPHKRPQARALKKPLKADLGHETVFFLHVYKGCFRPFK